MEVHFLGKLPDNYSAYGKLDEFDEYDMEELNSFGFDEVWYWYSTAPYEGSGQILIRKGKLYDLHDAGHCSCYGPIDQLEFNGKPLKELAESINEEYMRNEAKPLFEMAGYKF